MFGLVHCNASILARQNTDPNLFFVRTLIRNWLWPILTFFGVTGNVLAIIVLTKRRMIMSSTNNYLVALALVDIAYLVLTLLMNTFQHPCFTNNSLSEIILTICRPIADVSSNSSVWLTVTFTVERWVAITYPLQSRTWCTVHRARKIIFGILFASLVCTLPSAFELKLVKVIEIQNVSNKTVYTSYIRSKPTALGNSPLYHQIYFNFVAFAIIWIPLVLLLIFNTVLIISVHRSKDYEQESRSSMKLRRHSRGNIGEQRKTTIMLIAVVIVFTVCQIPQAISLTVQWVFPKIAQTSKVLIYNNFANFFVAINASINFLLYCCFSHRFRSIFSSYFTCFRRCYIYCTERKSSLNNEQDQHIYQNSLDFVSSTNPSTFSLHSNQLNRRRSSIHTDLNQRCSTLVNKRSSQSADTTSSSWFTRLSCLSSKLKLMSNNNSERRTIRFSQSSDSVQSLQSKQHVPTPSTPRNNTIRNPIITTRHVSAQKTPNGHSKALKVSINDTRDEQGFSTPFIHQGSDSVQLTRSILRPRPISKSSSYNTLKEKLQNDELIWIQHRRSNTMRERVAKRRKLSNRVELHDIPV